MLEMMEAVKARTLLDQMHVEFRELPAPELQKQAMNIEQELTYFAPDTEPDEVLSEIRLTSQLPLENRSGPSPQQDLLQQVERIYTEANAGFSGVQPVRSLAEIQQALKPREAILEYAIPYHPLHPAFSLHALVVTPGDAFHLQCDLSLLPASSFIGKLIADDKQPMDASPLGQTIINARTAIQDGEDPDADTSLQLLHCLLIAPLLTRGLDLKSLDRLVIVPHRMLHSVPWAALCSKDGRRVVEDVAVTVAPSASIWHTLATRAPLRLESFLALANPQPMPNPKLPSLEQAESEVDDIGKALVGLKSTVLKKTEATEDALRREVAGKSIVHFATHGEFPMQDALDFHSLLLAPSDSNDGRVRAEELRAMDFHSASLVVLSICNGGIYRFGPGDEPYGLSPALLAAGAHHLLGTLWSIEDWAGRQFVVKFYSNVLKSGPAEALRLAASDYLAKGWDLRLWAAFVAVGTGRPFAV
jgi:CHAT domain-containing protein